MWLQPKRIGLTSNLRTSSEYRLCYRSELLTIDELVLGYLVPSVPDGASLLKVVDRVCGRQEYGDPKKETGDRQEKKEERPYQADCHPVGNYIRLQRSPDPVVFDT